MTESDDIAGSARVSWGYVLSAYAQSDVDKLAGNRILAIRNNELGFSTIDRCVMRLVVQNGERLTIFNPANRVGVILKGNSVMGLLEIVDRL